MLLTGSRLIDAPVMGLQTGGELARTKRAIVDPGTLKVIAYELEGPLLTNNPTLLRVADVREFSSVGLIIDSSDEFTVLGEVIKLDEIYHLHFDPVGMKVASEKGKKIGKVIHYTIDTKGFYIHQLGVRRTLLASLGETELLVHRSQIIEINDEAIVIEEQQKLREATKIIPNQAYVNPFRKDPEPQTDHIDRL